MNFENAFYSALKKSIELAGGQAGYQEKTGVPQGQISKVLAGEKVKKGEASEDILKNKKYTANPGLEIINSLIRGFDDKVFIDFVKEIRPELPIDVINLEGLHEVKAYNISGYSTLEEMFASDVKFTLKIPSNFFPSDFCVIQDGHSMEPEIPDGAAVGVKLLKNPEKEMRSGELYLCSLPRHNLVFRRVSVTENVQQFEFTPDNPIPKYKQLSFWAEEATKMILGSVTWVAVRKKHSL